MHPIQKKILSISENKNIGEMTLREIAFAIGETHPQKVKHHMNQLEKKGLLKLDKVNKVVEKSKSGFIEEDNVVSIPILGTANCGPATFFANENFEGYLKVSPKLLPKKNDLYIIKASGNSMNKANIDGKAIDDGDYAVVDSTYKYPQDMDYVVAIIGEVANIKRFRLDRENQQIVLVSESSEEFDPIFIHPDDLADFKISGKVVQIIKKPKFD